MSRRLLLAPWSLAICRFAADAAIPAWVFHASPTFWSLTRTPEELSLVCPVDDLPPSVEIWEGPWSAFVLEGPIAFDLTGIVNALTAPLAEAGIPVFVLSTHDTDVLLVRTEHLERARSALAPHFEIAPSND